MAEGAQCVLFLAVFLTLTPLLAAYIANLFIEEKPYLWSYLGRLEAFCYKAGGINPLREMDWKTYGKTLLLFNLSGLVFLFCLQLAQGALPLNPEGLAGVDWTLALNTAMSFTTNTNWQSYSGETTLSYLTQMLGLTSQNFLSASSGFSALLVLLRGLTRNSMDTVGNCWRDLTRVLVYLFLPLSFIFSLFLVSQGVIQTLSPYVHLETMEGQEQTIPLGPVASQEAIKQLGANGGGFFNANSAHPFENPTPLTNFFEMLAILLIPAATAIAFGRMMGKEQEGWLIFSVMFGFWLVSSGLMFLFDETWEGKETRIGIGNSLLWTVSTTATSNGSTNAVIGSLSPLATGIALFNMKLGELIFGGIGTGLAMMLMYIFLTVFMSGLMVGRTPEYLGKKIEKREMQWVCLAVLLSSSFILIGSGFIVSTMPNGGPRVLSQVLYTFSSTFENNGSSMGLDVNTPFYHLLLAFFMLFGRMTIILSTLALGGLLVRKKIIPESKGTLSTSSPIFGLMLAGTIVIVGGLTFFPALSLGPILEYFLLQEGRFF